MTFKTQIASDLSNVFFNADEFGEAITYTPSGGSPVSITAILGEVDPAIIADAPPGDSLLLEVQYSEVPNPQNGDTFTIDSETYYLVQNVGGGYQDIWQLIVSRSDRRAF